MNSKNEKLYTRETLLIKLRNQHDDDSWEEFVSYYSNYVFAVLKGMGVEFDDLDDIKQSILLKIWKKIPDFDYNPEKGSFRAWLCTVIRNTVYNYFRDRVSTYELKDEDSINAEVDKIAQREWMTHIASLAWENIKGDFSDSVRETYIQISQGRKSEEIAADLGISPGSVYVYKERVQKALRKEVRRLDRELG